MLAEIDGSEIKLIIEGWLTWSRRLLTGHRTLLEQFRARSDPHRENVWFEHGLPDESHIFSFSPALRTPRPAEHLRALGADAASSPAWSLRLVDGDPAKLPLDSI